LDQIIINVQKSWARSAKAQLFFSGRGSKPAASFSLYKPVNKSWEIELEHMLDYSSTSYLDGKELEYENNKYGGSFISTDNYVKSKIDGNYNEDKIKKAILKILDSKHIQRIILMNQFIES